MQGRLDNIAGMYEGLKLSYILSVKDHSSFIFFTV